MGIITKMRIHKAMWWSKTGSDEVGDPTYAEPVEFDCRWDEEAKLFLAPNKSEMVSSSVVYPDRDMKPGDMVWRGDEESYLVDWALDSDPLEVTGAFEIIQYGKIDKLKGGPEKLRTLYLV